MSYKLFYSPGACSMAVHVALNEVGAQYELVRANLHGAEKDAALLAVNPRHQVPVLVDGDMVIREGAAQMIHILEKHKSPLLPASGPERARALEWLCFCNATLHPAYGLGFAARKISPDANVQDAVSTFTQTRVQALLNDVDAHLANSKYLAGDNVTIADILLAVIANWSGKIAKPVTPGANIKRVLRDIVARPSYQQALKTEQVEYKEAA